MARLTALFDSRAEAEAALTELRRMGVPDTSLSVIGPHTPDETTTEGAARPRADAAGGYHPSETAADTGKGLAAGAGIGAVFGLAAALIPGVGPFISAGVLATSLGAAGTGAVAGALAGGTIGAIGGALVHAGYSREEADYYAERIQRGSYLVAVEDDHGLPLSTVLDVLDRHGGHRFGHPAR